MPNTASRAKINAHNFQTKLKAEEIVFNVKVSDSMAFLRRNSSGYRTGWVNAMTQPTERTIYATVGMIETKV